METNMKKILVAALCAAAALGSMGIAGCGSNNSARKAADDLRYAEQKVIDQQVQELRQNEPLPHFHDSAALHVQDAYYTADADPNKIWYVTVVSMQGQVLDHFTTRGAPQPSGDQVTNPVQQVCATHVQGHAGNCDTIGLPEPNGVHQGINNEGYVAILTTGAMKRFSCMSVYCDISDQPENVTSKPVLSINENAPISKTDSSKTENAVIPSGTGTRQK